MSTITSMNKLSSPIKLIQDSIKIFFDKKNLLYLALIYSVLVPLQVASYFIGSPVDPSTGNIKNPTLFAVYLVVGILYILISLLVSVAGVAAVKRVVSGGALNIKETFSFALKNLWNFLLLSSLVFLAVLGGTILLVIPGIIFGIWFSFAKFVFIDQGLPIKASMAKSHDLVRGRFWAVLGRLFVFGLFGSLVGAIVSAIPFDIGSILVALAGGLFMLPVFLLYKELNG